ncbi:MAG: hypothetical protein Fur0021_09380 [Candidatus Promineifilaceae bacterium]
MGSEAQEFVQLGGVGGVGALDCQFTEASRLAVPQKGGLQARPTGGRNLT